MNTSPQEHDAGAAAAAAAPAPAAAASYVSDFSDTPVSEDNFALRSPGVSRTGDAETRANAIFKQVGLAEGGASVVTAPVVGASGSASVALSAAPSESADALGYGTTYT